MISSISFGWIEKHNNIKFIIFNSNTIEKVSPLLHTLSYADVDIKSAENIKVMRTPYLDFLKTKVNYAEKKIIFATFILIIFEWFFSMLV